MTVVNTTGTTASFTVNGSSRCTVTTNIPTTTARATSFGSMLKKAAGLTDRTVEIDYLEVIGNLATPH